MKNLLKLNELNLELNSKDKFIVKELNLDVYIDNTIVGYVNFIIVKESHSHNTLEGYLDQVEEDDMNMIQLKYLKLKDTEYGTKLPSGDLIFIDEIYLRESYRGKKYGSTILTELISYAKNININRLVLSPQPIGLNKNNKLFRERALKLELWYEKHDFKTYNSTDDDFKYMIKILD